MPLATAATSAMAATMAPAFFVPLSRSLFVSNSRMTGANATAATMTPRSVCTQ